MIEPKLKEKSWIKDIEPLLYEEWKNSEIFSFKQSKKKIFSIDTPPPYVNTPVHIGQVTTYVLMDMFARYKRMQGFNVLFPLGLDRNGLPIEMAAEKKFGIKLTELPREKAVEACKKILEEASIESVKSFLRCGISFNSWNIGTGIGEVYETDSTDYRALTQETFIDLWSKGLIFEDDRINNWCPGCQTTLADAEVDYEEKRSIFNDIIFKVKETSEEIIIGTTRPELISTCAMIIFHHDDDRYKHLDGKTAVTPIFNKSVPIKAHPQADPAKGTGIAMMCSAGDLADIRFFREMNLEPVIAINKNGTMNEHAGFLKGLQVKDARQKIINELKLKKLLAKQTPLLHRTPVCERSKDEIEFIAMNEFYLKQVEFKKEMKNLADKINFFDRTSKQILLRWIDDISIDWPISRRRYYATEVPLWYCKKCNTPVIPPKGKYYQPWKEKCPVKKCVKCNTSDFKGETRVFDTWFDSSISPLYILKWNRNNEFFKKSAPCSLRPQGKEIIRTWLYYTLLKCYLLTEECIFKDAWINYHIVDEHGHKMSKSKGNGIDPKEVLDKFGAEPFRLWAAIEGNLEKTDFRCSFERIDGAGKTLTKLWNVSRFISMFDQATAPKKLQHLDEWILHELNHIVQLALERYNAYDFHNPSIALKHFLWETFASHYLELVKNRAYNDSAKFSNEEKQSALYTLHTCLKRILRLWAPVLPFLTYKIFKDVYNEDINKLPFPDLSEEYKIGFKTEELIELNSAIWKAKKDKGLSLKSEVKSLALPEKFKHIKADLAATHNIKNISYNEKLEIYF
ncbi:valine--tRNA ligase [Candidatus Woesearchaeota archaeon]|nr:valine--tRNA ligase [Candidatus Woesearchaeota archaeon]